DAPADARDAATPAPRADACRAERCIEDAQYRWELVQSTDYDPTGEVPSAGWWLRRVGKDGGSDVRWYLGIKEHRPYALRPASAPFVADGELRLPVRRAEIRGPIAFPPVGLDITRDGEPKLLVATLDDIARDSDGDGLTDLAEQQLLLDPHVADSDGDGIVDGADPLPNVAYRTSPGGTTPFVAALKSLLDAPDRAISFGVPGSDAFARRRSGNERTLYLVADPVLVEGVGSDVRIIVLPPSLDLRTLHANAAFSLSFPMHTSFRRLDERRAEFVYSFGWRGGTLALELRDGVWRIGELEGWIT
ncbi:MAG TPA: hypothetical protein VJ724_06380, partial [Tahibacter sp.]|nr:hypothetical protein [Tahibacter sp.]